MTDDYREANRRLWDAWTAVHASSSFYDVPGFLAGRSSLHDIEREEVGSVAGRTLLHLQCHFGLDTLSWARLGARVTGLDFSPAAIELARSLSARTALDARFVCADVYDAPAALGDERFDIVYTSYGVLGWLPDLDAWAAVVAATLRPGGVFHLIEFHPLAFALDADGVRMDSACMGGARLDLVAEGSYADAAAPVRLPEHNWAHGLGDVVEAVLRAGLRLESLRELPVSPHPCFPFLTEVEPGTWTTRHLPGEVPLTFALRARLP